MNKIVGLTNYISNYNNKWWEVRIFIVFFFGRTMMVTNEVNFYSREIRIVIARAIAIKSVYEKIIVVMK